MFRSLRKALPVPNAVVSGLLCVANADGQISLLEGALFEMALCNLRIEWSQVYMLSHHGMGASVLP